MSVLGFLPDLLPIRRFKAADQLAIWSVSELHDKQPAVPKIWADHIASIADYREHKLRHPDTGAGAMTVLYAWAPVIAGVVAIATFNPAIIGIAAVADKSRSRRAAADIGHRLRDSRIARWFVSRV